MRAARGRNIRAHKVGSVEEERFDRHICGMDARCCSFLRFIRIQLFCYTLFGSVFFRTATVAIPKVTAESENHVIE